MAKFYTSLSSNPMVSVSANTTSQAVQIEAVGGRPRNVVATIFAHGTFVSGDSSVTFQIAADTSASGARHWVPLNLDPSGNLDFITSGTFTSAGAVNIEVGTGSAIRAIVATTATGPISLFYQI